MKPLLALVLTAVSLVVGAANAASPLYRYDERLSAIARQTLWRAALDAGLRRGKVESVGVRCYRDARTFEDVFRARTGASATRIVAYYAGGRDVHLRSTTCGNIHLFFAGRNTVRTAGAYAVLLHEALHRQGLSDERLTTCFANEAVRWGAEWFGLDRDAALRARNLAFDYTRLHSPPAYRMGRPNCLALTERMEWVRAR